MFLGGNLQLPARGDGDRLFLEMHGSKKKIK